MGGNNPMQGLSGFLGATGIGETTTPPHVQEFQALTPEQQELLSKLSTQLTGQVGQGVGIDPSGLQQAGFGAAEQMLAGGAPGAGEAQTALQRILAGPADIGPTAGGRDPEGARRYWKEAFVDPSMDLWSGIQAKTLEPFAGTGGLRSGGAMRAMGRAGKEFTTGLTGQLADIMYKGEEAARGREFAGQESWLNRLLQVPAMGQTMTQTGMAPIQQALQAGETQFGIGQMGEAWNNPWMQVLGTALGTQPYERIGMPESTQRGIWGQFMGK